MPDTLTKVIAILGFALACVSLGWHVWTYRQGRKEKIEAKAWMEYAVPPTSAPAIMYVRVRNAGDRPVYISEVVIAYAVPAPGGDAEHCRDDVGGTGTHSLFAVEDSDKALQPGQAREYTLAAAYDEWFDDLLRVPKDNVWLSVCSPGGEVKKLSDPRTRMLIWQFVDAVRGHVPDLAGPV